MNLVIVTTRNSYLEGAPPYARLTLRRRALQAVGLAPFLPMPAAQLCGRPGR
jgi:hypothetical protein